MPAELVLIAHSLTSAALLLGAYIAFPPPTLSGSPTVGPSPVSVDSGPKLLRALTTPLAAASR